MGEIKRRLIECALREWRYFGASTRDIEDRWNIVGTQSAEPFRSHINHYWRAAGEPDWDGGTDEPWSAAFISWCFKIAGAGAFFSPDGTHSVYIDRIRRHDGMSDLLVLHDPATVAVAPGDLIWNSRQPDLANPVADIPLTYEAAVDRLATEDYFASHVDIVIAVEDGRCESIGGNVSPPGVGGSVTRSAWRLDSEGRLADPRKAWIGVVANGL
jgi:hypothetical protein